MKRHLILLAAALSSSAFASNEIPGKTQKNAVAIVGGTIHTVSGPSIANGTIVFDNGKIAAVGAGVKPPAGAEIINATGKHVYPGLISSDTTIGLNEINSVRASLDFAEIGSVNPNVRAQSAFNPDSEHIPVVRANGITMAVVAPNGGLISGMSAMMLMDGWTPEEMTLKTPLALNVQWPRIVINRNPFPNQKSEEEQNKERDKAVKELKDAFKDARAYYTAKGAEGKKAVPYHDVDLRWEAMIPVLEGKVPVVVWANEIQQIKAAVAWAQSEKIKLIIGGGHDAWRVADLLKISSVPVLAGGVYELPSRTFDEYDDPFTLAAKLNTAGVKVAIITANDVSNERNLPYQAAKAAAYGLPKEEALKAITLYPAQIFGVDDRVGSLEVGKDATLIVTNGDPLEIMTNVEMEFIQGRKIALTSKHTRLYEKYKEKYRSKSEKN